MKGQPAVRTPDEPTARVRRDRAIHPGATLDARFLIDRGLVEILWNGGEAAYAVASLPTDAGPAFALEGEAAIEELTLYPVANIWN